MAVKASTTELVVRLRALNGKDTTTAEDVQASMDAREIGGKKRFHVSEVEGGSLDREILGVAVRECLNAIFASMGKPLVDFQSECARQWETVKGRIEPILQGRYAQCPVCASYALSDALHDADKFICPACGSKLRWKAIPDVKRPEITRYILTK